jgi:hypothetical protein
MSETTPIDPLMDISDDDLADFTNETGLDPHDRTSWSPGDYTRAVAWLRSAAKAQQSGAINLAFDATDPEKPI